MTFHEGLLDRCQIIGGTQSLDGDDFVALGAAGEHQAGSHRLAVQQYRARTADPVLTSGMGAGETAVVTQGIVEQSPVGHFDVPAGTVDREVQRCGRFGLGTEMVSGAHRVPFPS